MYSDRLEILSHGGLPRGMTEKKILKLLLDNPNLTAETLASLIGVSKRTAERNLSDLQQKGKIERIGSKRDGQWIVIR